MNAWLLLDRKLVASPSFLFSSFALRSLIRTIKNPLVAVHIALAFWNRRCRPCLCAVYPGDICHCGEDDNSSNNKKLFRNTQKSSITICLFGDHKLNTEQICVYIFHSQVVFFSLAHFEPSVHEHGHLSLANDFFFFVLVSAVWVRVDIQHEAAVDTNVSHHVGITLSHTHTHTVAHTELTRANRHTRRNNFSSFHLFDWIERRTDRNE